MNTLTLNQPSRSSAFLGALSTETLRQRVPAVFAPSAHESRSPAYTFISTATVVDACAHRGSSPWRLARPFVFPRGVAQLHLTGYSTPSRRSRSLMTRQ